MLRGRALGALVTLAALGCGGGDSGTDPVDQRGAIAGSVRNGGTGVANVSVALTGGASRTATTSAGGTYSFGQLEAGAYTVAITVPAGLQLAAGQTASRAVTVTASQTATVDFGLEAVPVAPGAIGGHVRAGTDGVAGATLTLTAAAVNRTAMTAADGAYALAAVAPGTYTLALTVPAGFTMAAGQTATRAVNVASSATATVDFGLVALAPATEINVNGFTFSPAEVTVAPGTRVRWVNGSGMLHTVTPDGHAQWADTNLTEGGIFEHVFNTPGVYPYYCTPHRGVGMTGVIRVQ